MMNCVLGWGYNNTNLGGIRAHKIFLFKSGKLGKIKITPLNYTAKRSHKFPFQCTATAMFIVPSHPLRVSIR
jgi:hypothetical protein